ncbi:glycosyltransferase family 2 protein [Alteromonas sp. H39]|uniref:glycosyltransferase family 2 protein n=1 Tax=Alteromonas sp. H39 TaxID=3389876 RepID=UPI0039DF3E92
MNTSTSLTVVICNYNKREYLKACLDSLQETDQRQLNMQVMVVDNASEDGSQDMVREHYSDWVSLVAMSENTGGAGGFRRGMEEAMKTGSEFIALLDNDILLDSDTLPTLISYLLSRPEVAVAGAKICTMDNPEILQELGAFVDWERYSVATPFKGHKDDASLPAAVSCDYVPACCLVTRRDIVASIGLFDDAHFIYWDDIDWCQRIKRAGFEIHAVRDARVLHKMGAVFTPNTFSNYYFERNRLRFFANYLDESTFEAFARKRCEELAPQAFFANRKGKLAQVHSAHFALMDFARGRWYEQPDAILQKEAGDGFGHLSEVTSVHLRGADDSLINRVSALLPKRIRQCADTAAESAEHVTVCAHVLSVTPPDEGWVIDQHGNSCHVTEHAGLVESFERFRQIFSDVQIPVYLREIMAGYRSYHASGRTV